MSLEKFKEENQFFVEGIRVDFESSMKYYKRLYKTYDNYFDNCIKDNPHQSMLDFAKIVEENWDVISEITVSEAFAEKNIEIRRLYFKAIGVIELFKELEPTLIDKQVLEKEGISWLENGTEIPTTIRDEYELYTIPGEKLFPEESSSWRVANATIYAVRCWCSTTGREYWIYVPNNIGQKNDALEAIAWTVQLNITDPEYIYRQGDVILAKYSERSEPCRPYHLSASQYVKLLKAES
jgi:hypothetical protein